MHIYIIDFVGNRPRTKFLGRWEDLLRHIHIHPNYGCVYKYNWGKCILWNNSNQIFKRFEFRGLTSSSSFNPDTTERKVRHPSRSSSSNPNKFGRTLKRPPPWSPWNRLASAFDMAQLAYQCRSGKYAPIKSILFHYKKETIIIEIHYLLYMCIFAIFYDLNKE